MCLGCVENPPEYSIYLFTYINLRVGKENSSKRTNKKQNLWRKGLLRSSDTKSDTKGFKGFCWYTIKTMEPPQFRILRHKNGKLIRVTNDWQYILLRDIEFVLGLKRTNIRGKDTVKYRVLDQSRNREQEMTFIHAKHLEGLCKRSTRLTKCEWVLGQFSARDKPTVTGCRTHDALQLAATTVLENFWTRLPNEVVSILEIALDRVGFVEKLKQQDEHLRRMDAQKRKQNQDDQKHDE